MNLLMTSGLMVSITVLEPVIQQLTIQESGMTIREAFTTYFQEH